MTDPVLVLDQVKHFYTQGGREVRVLRSASFIVQPGEVKSLFAPSGSGKSTLLQVAGTLERSRGGEVIICGRSCAALSDRERTFIRKRSIGFVYQAHHLLADFNALENVMLPLLVARHSRGKSKKRALELLEYLGLKDRSLHRPSELSGGEQQRVAVARAVIHAPAIVLADEPTGNLDPGTSKTVFSLLTGLAKESGVALVVATHNLELAKSADSVHTIQDGQIVEISI